MTIKAIAFDLGGVLFSEGKSVAVKILEDKYSYDRNLIMGVFKSPQSLDLHKGLITEKAFWEWARTQLPTDYDVEIIRKEWYDGYILDEDIFTLMKNLKGKYKIIAFSGNIKERIEHLNQKYNFRRIFDIEIYSFTYHVCKPQREFFDILIAKSGVKPEEIVYVDDSEIWSKGATQLGIKVLLYQRGEIEKLQTRLKEFGICAQNLKTSITTK